MLACVGAAGARRAAIGQLRQDVHGAAIALDARYVAFFSSSGGGSGGGGGSGKGFRPRRRVPRTYRPLQPRSKGKGPLRQNDSMLLRGPGAKAAPAGGALADDAEAQFGPDAADALRHSRREAERGGPPDIEAQLRAIDYMTAAPGSTEDLVGERRGAMDSWDEKERMEFSESLDKLIEKERINSLGLGDDDNESEDNKGPGRDTRGLGEDPNQKAFGTWSETIIRVDRVQKVQRGGTMVRYRCLVIGGNANGCGGFGIGKAASPAEATAVAVRMCKRNIFFVDRYQNSGLSYDLAGKHNSCRVLLRSMEPNVGLKGHDLILLILKYFGITDCSAKSHGNRNIYNVVRATFKALMTHESLEDIALKRGKRLINLERAKRLQI